MIPLVTLWLPIVLSAVAVFILSALIWMVLPWHRNDFRGLPDEPAARAALAGATPALYTIPHAARREDFGTAEHRKKLEEGPVAYVTVMPKGVPSMGKSFVQWFVWSLVVSLTAAYLASRTLAPGTDYLQVFRVTGTTAWLAYSWAAVQEGIWFGRPWSLVVKHLVDGLIYALATAGFFGWLWP